MTAKKRIKLPRTMLDEFMPGKVHRFRVRTRSRFVGGTFNSINLFTRYDVEGRDHLFEAIERSRATGRGLITVSNHVSLFDDPMVLIAILKLRNFTVETKCWWSTACATNFNPQGKGFGARVTRWFNEVSNMVFMARAYKGSKAAKTAASLVDTLGPRLGWSRMERLEERAKRLGTDSESYLRSFLTARPGQAPTSLDQPGLLEACARVNVGDWLHFFPEGGRSRNMSLRPARPGAGKVIFHSPEAEVVPICFYGSQDVLPIGGVVPRPFQKVVVSIGRPLSRAVVESLRRQPATPEAFLDVSRFAMSAVGALRPGVLARYLGAQKAFDLLAEEQAEEAMARQAVEPAAAARPETAVPWPSVLEDAVRRPDRRLDA